MGVVKYTCCVLVARIVVMVKVDLTRKKRKKNIKHENTQQTHAARVQMRGVQWLHRTCQEALETWYFRAKLTLPCFVICKAFLKDYVYFSLAPFTVAGPFLNQKSTRIQYKPCSCIERLKFVQNFCFCPMLFSKFRCKKVTSHQTFVKCRIIWVYVEVRAPIRSVYALNISMWDPMCTTVGWRINVVKTPGIEE